MPFTLAHPAAVVPLARRSSGRLVLPALVVGSMAPDFEYFASLRPIRTIGHDPIGIPLLCVPSGLAVLWLFERIMKRPMALLLPSWLRGRILPHARPMSFLPAGRFAAIVASLAIGAFTHVAWDSMTHAGGWVVERVPPLSAPIAPGLPAFKALQYASSVGGMALLALWSWGWIASRTGEGTPDAPIMSDRTRAGVVSALMMVAGGSALAALLLSPPLPWYALIVRAVIGGISALCVGSLIYCIAWRICEAKGSRPAGEMDEAAEVRRSPA